MKTGRMAAYEAPRIIPAGREMRDINLHCAGRTPGGAWQTVRIPKAMPLPDLIRWHGRTFMKRGRDTYSEATMWPIDEELDANGR